MTGLTIILAIPYFLLKKKGGKPSGEKISTSFAQMLQQSRKKSVSGGGQHERSDDGRCTPSRHVIRLKLSLHPLRSQTGHTA